MNKILIIGSDSFIAQRFIDKYRTIFDFSGVARIKTALKNEILLNDFNEIPESIFSGIDYVINFAAIVHQPQVKDPELYDKINHQLPVSLAEKAKKAEVKQFIQMSTIAVYGDCNQITINSEEKPVNDYGRSKLTADRDLLALHSDNFNVAIIRPPMVYGGGKAPGNMLRLINLAKKRLPLPFKGVDNKRDFINVHNLIQYLKIIIDKNLSGIYLVKDGEPVSTYEILKTIEHHLGKKVAQIAVPAFILKLIKTLRPKEYNKLFGTLTVDSNFPYEELVDRVSFSEGIREMIIRV